MPLSEAKLKEIEARHFARKTASSAHDPVIEDFDQLLQTVNESRRHDRDALIEMSMRFTVAAIAAGAALTTHMAVQMAEEVLWHIDDRRAP